MKKLIKGLLIFICIFMIVAFGITYMSILNARKKIITLNENGIDLYGTYNQNDLLINELIENYNGVDIKIPKIDGLKDTNVQDKVNQDIYNRVYEVLSKYSEINYANYYTRANFANVISIGFHIGSDNKSEQLYLNYNLINGEKLKLEELFINENDITDIVRQAFYKASVQENQYKSENNIVSPDEDKIYKLVKGYMEESDKRFAFSPSEILFYYKDDMASVKMIDIYDKVSIYSKYLTDKSIYIKDDIGYKNIFTCANGNYDIFENIEYGYLEDNFWYDITIGSMYEDYDIEKDKLDKFNNFKENIYNEVDEKVNEYREIAKNNPDKFYILFAKPSASIYSNSKYEDGKWKYTYSNIANVYKNIQIFEMPLKIYEEIYKDKLIDTYRYQYFEMRGGSYLDTDAKDGATITRLEEAKIYNYITDEEITKIEDVFYEDSNYIEVIKNKTKDRLVEKNYTDNEISKLLETINYELDGTQVNVTIPSLKDFMVILYFNNFDSSMLKIF